MARARQDSRLVTRDSRLKLKARSEPYWRTISKGLALGYRKGASGGTWIGRHFSIVTGRRFKSIGVADDHEDGDSIRVLSFTQAQKHLDAWVKRLDAEDAGEVVAGSYTVGNALADYISNLEREKRKKLPDMWTAANAHILPTLGHIELVKLRHGKMKAWCDGIADAAPRVRTGYVKEKVWIINKRTGKGQFRDRATTVKLEQVYRTIDTEDAEAIRKRHATANRILTIVKSALNHAYTQRRITSKSAWESIKPFKAVDAPKIRFLSLVEVSAFTNACEDEDFLKLSKGALLTGARYSELGRLIVEDFNPHDAKVYVAKSKNGEARYIDLNDEGVALFTELTEGRAANELIFLRSNGKPWKKSEQKRPMDATCTAAHIEGATFHILRHTYASHAVMNGMPIEVLAEVLGHKDTRITMRHYAHLCRTYKQKLVRANAPTFGFAPALPEPPAPVVMPEYPPLPAERRTGRLLAMAGR